MVLQITHTKVATYPDEPGAEINKAEWNDFHNVTGTIDQSQNNVAVDGVTITGDGTPGNPLVGSGGSAVPGGSTGDVQFNNGGSFDGNGSFSWDDTNKGLSIQGLDPSYSLTSVDGNSFSGYTSYNAGGESASLVMGGSSSPLGSRSAIISNSSNGFAIVDGPLSDLMTLSPSGDGVFTGTLSASNLSGTNTGDVTLTTTGTSGPATLVGQVLNIPQYSGGGSSPLTTKGDLYTYSTVDTRLPVGTNGFVLTADSTQATGLKWSASTGTVTSVSVVSANGFAGSVATATTTPAITLSTTITGLLKGNGTAISAATAGTDYEVPLTFSTGLTRATNTITANLSTGISGGQSAIGGTASGENLTLSSTSNATKGNILIGNSAYDEVNNRLYIGQSTGTAKLDVLHATTTLGGRFATANSGLRFQEYTGLNTYYAIYPNGVTPGTTNYTIAVRNDGGDTAINGASGLLTMSVGGAAANARLTVNTTGVYIGGNSSATRRLDVNDAAVAGTDLALFRASGTAAAGNAKTAVNIQTSGANATSTQTTYGMQVSNTSTGTASTNIGAMFGASGGTTNYAAKFTAPILMDSGIAIQLDNASSSITGASNGVAYRSAFFHDFYTQSTTNFRFADNQFGINSYILKNISMGANALGTARLHFVAQTASASSSPIKFTGSATLMTTPEDGAFEYNASHLYFTIGSTRYQLDQQASSLYYTWNNITATSQTAAVNNAYVLNNAALVTLTLPATSAIGDRVIAQGKGAGGWKVAQNASQVIHFGNIDTTTGTGGSLASTSQYDSVELVCITANTDWVVRNVQGNLTVV